MHIRILSVIISLLLLVSVSAHAGIDALQIDDQAGILGKIAEPTDGAVLTVQQGPTEASTTVKLQIKDKDGNVVASVTADGTINIASGAHYKINGTNLSASNVGAEPAISSGTSGQYWRGDKTFQTLNSTAVGAEPAISAGTTSQYWRGDKSFQTLDATAVGLGNVTNDAQLKRASGDINSLTSKATPGTSDIVVIEDAGASYAKKKATISSLALATSLPDITDTGGKIGIGTTSPQELLDIRGNIYVPQADSAVDWDGTTTTGVGTCESIAEGAALVSITDSNVDLDGNGTADTYYLCTNSLLAPTILGQSLEASCNLGISPVTFTGSGLNDATSGGTYSSSANNTYTAVIDAVTGSVSGVSVAAAGSGGYQLYDVLTIVGGGGSGATVTCYGTGGGGCTSVVPTAGGSGYVAGNGLATTGGHGTGCTVNITAITPTLNTFKWKKNSGSYTTGVTVTGSAQTLTDGVTITFAAALGHTLTDQWVISGKTIGLLLRGTNTWTTTASYTTPIRVTTGSGWSFKDSNSNSKLNLGEDIYIDNVPANKYYSTSTIFKGTLVIQ